MQFVNTLKIHQIDIVIFKCHTNSFRIRNGIISPLHNHVFNLTHQVVLLRLGWVGSYHTANYNIRVKIIPHHISRKVVVNSSVVSQYAVYFYRLEHEWKTHRCPDGISQVTFSHHKLLLIVHIGSNTAKRYKQFIEITITSCSGTGKEIDKH
ncbi:hypothetical protein EVA_06575 [gut metagenome]|uniref:Uncharacterized protein n=1 Tax=gut metagenome TaxID=749906 RepID=J9GDA1_9ZZZZ